MRYLALVCDYDGTLARRGAVAEDTLAALERLRDSGRKVILLTGRLLRDIIAVLPRHDLFDRIVAENGAVLYRPIGREERLLAEAPPSGFVDRLRGAGVDPLSVGRAIVSTSASHGHAVLDAIRQSGLELRIVYNRDALIVLPAEIGKGTGLQAALSELGMSPHEVVGIGNAENDHAFLGLCECSATVADAIPSIRDRADIVTKGDDGAGVVELVERLLQDDLRNAEPRLTRRHVLLGTTDDGEPLLIPPYGGNVLVVGPSGSGKTTFAMALLERLAEQSYQFVAVDPEGDYSRFQDAIQQERDGGRSRRCRACNGRRGSTCPRDGDGQGAPVPRQRERCGSRGPTSSPKRPTGTVCSWTGYGREACARTRSRSMSG